MTSRFLLCVFAFSAIGAATRSADAPAGPSPLDPLAYWVGGTWRGELPPAPDGRVVAIETVFHWTENRQAVRFESTFVAGEKRAAYCSGIYGWDPGRNAIAFWYFDNGGTLYQGTVTVENDVLAHDFTATSRAGEVDHFRARVQRLGPDAYENTIQHPAEAGGEWQTIAVVRYHRT